jgi:hypothetical protein
MIYIATTTINKPTEALKKFAKNKECKLIVALDKNSKPFKLKNSVVLSTKYQEKKWPKLSNLIGWNCIGRRNFAILKAYEMGAKIIALIDDDNIPYDSWFKKIYIGSKINANKVNINKPVFDPVGYTNHKDLWHRGYPLEMVYGRKYKSDGKRKISPDVQASFWNGDPDIDAVTRVIFAPSCKFKKNYFPFFSRKISPFNSQNTLLNRKIIKDYFLFPHIGRMDDIWASYYVASKKYKILYAEPTVFQKRNKHNYLTDFNLEVLGYKNNVNLIKSLKKNPDNIKKFLPKKSILAFEEWKKIIRSIDEKK